MPENVGVIGSGSWGTTIAKILGENGHQVLLWTRRQELCDEINATRENASYLPGAKLAPGVMATTDLPRICETCRLIVMVVPSHGFRAVAHEIGGYLDGEHVLVHATKGIEQESFKRMSEILREETPVRKIGVLSGPNLARELADRKPSGTLVASHYDEVITRAQQALQSEYFRVYAGHDVVGAEIGGTFKNIVALAAGVVDGLKLGDNTKALLMTRGINEMARFGSAMGAKVLTFGGMAGFGDMMATCASSFSRNHQVGERLARGETLEEILEAMKMVAEGVKATRAVRTFTEGRGFSLPIVDAVYEVLYEGAPVPAAISKLMTLATGDEFRGLVL
ncbi:MAG: NAD(P)-dependent glycerol-3-phosphate dehydrogenase [Deltaproteobacteria bacterium]|nr:NAD(P)-dependent glycerol-3-phosphate dehydrogenase [Deltaproteobacteria bacterium]